MPKDKDQRIEGIFGQIGLGNLNPERILEIQEEYDRAMALADHVRGQRKGRRFKDALRTAEEEEAKKKKEEKPEKKPEE